MAADGAGGDDELVVSMGSINYYLCLALRLNVLSSGSLNVTQQTTKGGRVCVCVGGGGDDATRCLMDDAARDQR